jgi:hypothetical protein
MQSGADFQFTLPKPLYQPLQIGILQGKSKLEELLEKCKIPYTDFIIKVNAVKVSS